jgi:nitroimidazol reductase NimA-like FMN-containing flavoprotein (pyridoxamine 5'-phosphate oxidase superfamily)
MLIEEMTAQDCRAILAEATVAYLACALNNQPYIVQIHVDLEDGYLYSYSMLGQKIEWMRQNPLVCLHLDQVLDSGLRTSVVVNGRYEELPHTRDFENSRGVALRLFQRHAMWWEPASVPVKGHVQRQPIVFRIHIVSMTGRRMAVNQ